MWQGEDTKCVADAVGRHQQALHGADRHADPTPTRGPEGGQRHQVPEAHGGQCTALIQQRGAWQEGGGRGGGEQWLPTPEHVGEGWAPGIVNLSLGSGQWAHVTKKVRVGAQRRSPQSTCWPSRRVPNQSSNTIKLSLHTRQPAARTQRCRVQRTSMVNGRLFGWVVFCCCHIFCCCSSLVCGVPSPLP